MGSARFLDDEIGYLLQSYGWYAIILFTTWYVLKSYVHDGSKKIFLTVASDLKRKEVLDEEMKRIRKLQSQH